MFRPHNAVHMIIFIMSMCVSLCFKHSYPQDVYLEHDFYTQYPRKSVMGYLNTLFLLFFFIFYFFGLLDLPVSKKGVLKSLMMNVDFSVYSFALFMFQNYDENCKLLYGSFIFLVGVLLI